MPTGRSDRVWQLSGRTLMAGLALALPVLAVATVVEAVWGTDTAARCVYHAVWFRMAWVLLAMGMVAVVVGRTRHSRGRVVLWIHLSLATVVLGGVVTALTSSRGMLHLRCGKTAHTYVLSDGSTRPLPMAMSLDSFEIQYYTGTRTPADYVSHVRFQDARTGVISMNRTLTWEGFRFFQTSYDDDLQGSLLTVNHDPWGVPVTYTGFVSLLLGLLAWLLHPHGRFVRQCRTVTARRYVALCCLAPGVTAAGAQVQVVAPGRQQADSMRYVPVNYRERVAPFNTVALDFARKVHGRVWWNGLTAEQVLLGWRLSPDKWSHIPYIYIKDKTLRTRLGLTGSYASLHQLYHKGCYRLQELWQQLPDKQCAEARAIREVDEKVALVTQWLGGGLCREVPPEVGTMARRRVRAEVLYNAIPFAGWLCRCNLLLGVLLLLLAMWPRSRVWRYPRLWRWLTGWLYLLVLFACAGLVLRGYVVGHIPLTGSYETLYLASWLVLCLTLWLQRVHKAMYMVGLLLSGFILLVAQMGASNPAITQLMPVLNSPWLSWHVFTIMMAYVLLTLVAVLSLLDVVCRCGGRCYRMAATGQLALLRELLLRPALVLLAAGIVLGAVWANQSWGSYWTWDPKETWALITWLAYAMPLHDGLAPCFRHRVWRSIYLCAAFGILLMTYFGVNSWLGGLHSYGG